MKNYTKREMVKLWKKNRGITEAKDIQYVPATYYYKPCKTAIKDGISCSAMLRILVPINKQYSSSLELQRINNSGVYPFSLCLGIAN